MIAKVYVPQYVKSLVYHSLSLGDPLFYVLGVFTVVDQDIAKIHVLVDF